jgi:hypothetical protein
MKHFVKHGMYDFPEYTAWSAIKQRCYNPKNPGFRRYGGRGITMCARWMDFESFLADVGRRPSPAHSIDRFPNNDGNYEPGNVRWATVAEQHANKTQRTSPVVCGARYGRLIVLEKVRREIGRVWWKCRCDCGKILDVSANCLQRGSTRSCGCLQREVARKPMIERQGRQNARSASA